MAASKLEKQVAEFVPAPFSDLIHRVELELQTQGSVFGFSREKWFTPRPSDPDLGVIFHGHHAGNPVGPAAGPHTQMAQNILLSYLAGGRIMELKTVQVNDQLHISRPCIDMTNIGFNVEWSQELTIEQSLREYVAGMMLVEMMRARIPELRGADGDVIFDISLGYDLAGIRSEKIQRFLDRLHDASELIDQLRNEIPSRISGTRDIDFPSRVSDSVTLSTFHGCPADQIEKICEFLLIERGLNVIVKMNPPMLGRQKLEHLLHDLLGYTELTVNPSAYESGLKFEEAVPLVSRLTAVAKQRGLQFGCKFSNTLEVLNHRTFFAAENKVQYLSGQPLHVIAMVLTDEFRRAVGPAVPISFSAGIDKHNFADAVACRFVPVTTCTDLLRPGGYARLPAYLHALADVMKAMGAQNLDGFILDAFGHRDEAQRMATEKGCTQREWAAALNTTTVATRVRTDPRYRADQNRKVPPRTKSQLVVFDCLTCDKCIPVCPNAANFVYPTPKVAFEYHDILVTPSGQWRMDAAHRFEIDEELQIANFADFCNECGNCDTFCPEYGGPYIKKPSFYGSEDAFRAAAPRDGFFVQRTSHGRAICGRIRGEVLRLEVAEADESTFCDDSVMLRFSASHQIIECRLLREIQDEHRVDMSVFHTLRYLLAGVLDRRFVNQINIRDY